MLKVYVGIGYNFEFQVLIVVNIEYNLVFEVSLGDDMLKLLLFDMFVFVEMIEVNVLVDSKDDWMDNIWSDGDFGGLGQ